jgi:hypothetical protein
MNRALRDLNPRSGPRILRLLIILALCIVAFLATACETLRQPEEMTWQTMHAVDMVQTIDGMRDSCVTEGHPLTRRLIGKKPRTAEILGYGLGSAYVHLFISDLLRDQGLERAWAIWQFVSVTDTAIGMSRNHAIGVRIGKRNKTGCP